MFKQKPKTLITIQRVLLLATLAIVMVASFSMVFGRSETATAATSSTINFQARLLTAAGSVVPDGLYNVEFKLYNAATSSGSSQGSCSGDAACVWVETRTASNRVRLVNGYLTVNLGSVNAFGSINWDQEHWLAMNVGGTTGPSWDGEMTPRLKLTAVPHAFTAGKLVGGSGSNTTILDTGTPSGNNTISLPAESGTLCIQSSTACGFALSSGGANYIQNQFALSQAADFRINGSGRADTAFLSPSLRSVTDGTTGILLQNAAGTATAMSVDTTNSRVGIGGNFAPQQALDVIGNFQIRDAGTQTKAYRFRTSGSALDFEAAGANMYLSVWSNADYTGTQRNYLVLESGSSIARALGTWQFRASAEGATRHTIDGSTGASVAINQNGEATNFSVQGDTDASLLFVQGSTDRVGIGLNNPGYKLDVAGSINASTSMLAPIFDTATAVALGIGTTNATAINLNQSTTVASGKTFTVTSGATSLTGATTGTALSVSNSTSAGDILVLKDNSTTVMAVADGGSVTFTSSVNSSTALQVQNSAGGNVLSVNTTGSGATLSLGRSGASGHLGSVISQVYQGTSSTSQGFTFSSGVAAGASVIGSLTLSASSTTTVTVTDTAGNTYSVDASVTSGSVTTSYIFSSNITNAISNGDTLTITIGSGTGRWLVTANAFGNLLTPILDKTSTNTANSATMTTGTSATTTTANELVFATFGFGSGRTFTAGAGYTGIAQISTTAGSNDRSVGSEWKYVTSTGTQEGTASISSSGVYSAALATYRATNPSLGGSAGSVQLSDGTGGNNFVTLGTNTLTSNRTILLPDASGTLCIQGSTSCTNLQQAYQGSTGGTTPEIKLDSTRTGLDIQDADTTIGAAESLFAVRASNAAGLGSAMFQIQGSGAATFKNATNSTTAFAVQNAAGTSLFNVDTTNGRVGVGGVASFSKFEVIGGDAAVYNSGGNPRLVLGDSTSAGQNGYLQWDSTNDYFRIESVGTNGVKINDNYVAIGNIFPSQPLMVGNGSTLLFQVNTTGDVLTKTSTNSTTAFQVQNASSSSVLTVNTSTSGVTVNGALTQSGGAISLTGSTTSSISTASGTLTLQSVDANNNIVINGGSNSMTLNTGAAGTITVGSSNTTTVNIGAQTNNARTINIGNPSAASQAQTVNIGATAGTGAVTMRSGTGGTTLISTGSTVVRTQTDSITGFQIQDSTSSPIFAVDTVNNRVGVNLQTSNPAVALDVNGSIQQTGTETSDTVGTYANQWTKLGSCTITAQYQQCMTTLNLIGGANGNTAGNGQATISARVKQQNALGGAPINNLTFNGTAEVLTKDDFKMVTTTNTVSSTVVELWMRITTSYEHYNYTPVMNTGWNSSTVAAPWVWSPQNGFSASLPAGTQTAAVYSNSYANSLTVQSSTNSTTAVQVQNAAGNSLLSVSTSSNEINVGSTAQSVDLKMTGDMTWGTSLTAPQSFESTTFVPTTPGTWSTGGTSGWSRTTADAQAGSASAVSANVADSQNSWLDLNYTFPSAGALSFYWKVSSESGWDYLMFCIDNDANCTLAGGGEYQAISGNTAWAKITVPVAAGAHSFRWAYEKDNATTEGSDVAWIDNVQFTEGSVAGTISGDSLTFLASDTIQFSTTANANALTVDSNGRVGINTSAPTDALTVVGNYSVKDATTATKAYRFRTSGSALDFEGGGANMYLSAWTNADFSGTQYTGLILYSSQSRMDVKSAYTYFNPDTDAVSTVDINTPGTGTQDILRFAQAGTVIGYVRSNGSGVLTYQTFTGAHPAWTTENIDYGMVVSMTGDNRSRDPSNPSSEPYYGIKKTAEPNDPTVLGSYFGGPARGTWSFEDSDSVMAVGNGVMWVSDEGGGITRGDDFISSSLPGYAMKDGRQFAESNVIAKASEDVDWDAVTQTVDGRKVKMISVVYTSYTRLNAAGLAMGLASGGIVSNDITFNGLALFNGAVRFKSDVAFEGNIKVSDNTAGTVKIPAGQTSATVTFSKAYDKPPKVTTGISEFVDVAVHEKSNNGFTVHIPAPRASDTYIDWTAFEAP